MTSSFQHTLKRSVRFAGIGLHTGKAVTMTIRPAPVDFGICFKRVDTNCREINPVFIPATYQNVCSTAFCTSIGTACNAVQKDTGLDDSNLITVSTIEHLMAAFWGISIDNALVEIDGPEVPSMDGSAAPFYAIMKRAGVIEQDRPRRYIRLKTPVIVMNGESELRVEPYDGLYVDCKIDFSHHRIQPQRFSSHISKKIFEHSIAGARTFGFLKEVELLQKNGLARGGSLDNAIVVGENGDVLNKDGLRFSDEFVRHKVLDLLGDIYLLGYPIIGALHSKRSGHKLHVELVKKLMTLKDAWEWVIIREKRASHAAFPSIFAPVQPVATNA